MKKLFKTFALAALIVVVCTLALGWLFWGKRTVWPEFPSAADASAPQVVAQVERDFGWRTGDKIPITIYIKQPAGTEIDLNALAIQGDFEIAGPPTIYTSELKDGGRLIKITLNVQAMALKKSWKLNATMSYREPGQREDKLITLPGVELYTSATWDGRPNIKDGPYPTIQGYHLVVNSLMILAGVVVVLLCVRVIRVANRETEAQMEEIRLGPRDIARRDFEKVWARIQGGDIDVENYKEIERILRRLYRIEARTLREVDWELSNHPFRREALTVLWNCDKVIYRHRILSDKEHKAIFNSFMKMVPPPGYVPPKPEETPKKDVPPAPDAAKKDVPPAADTTE